MTILQQEYHKAIHMIDRIKSHEESAAEANKMKENKRKNTPKPAKTTAETNASFPHYTRIHEINSNWHFTMESMPRLSIYQLLFQQTKGYPQPFIPQLRMEQHRRSVQIILSSHDAPFTIHNLPYPILQEQARIDSMADATTQHKYWILSLPYYNPDSTSDVDECFQLPKSLFDAISILKDAPVKLAKELSCNSCYEPVITNAEKVSFLFPAPTDRWNDLQDYIACGTQETATGVFGKAIQQRDNVLLYDATNISLSVNQSTRTCALSMPKYGSTEMFSALVEPTISNHRLSDIEDSFSPLETPIVCQFCMSILGSATAVQQRLLLHRLAIDKVQLSHISRFIARVMMEQAESKAVFAMRIMCNDDISTHTRRSLVLRLISWDSFSAVGESAAVKTIQEVCNAMMKTATSKTNHVTTFNAANVRQTAKLLFTPESVPSREDDEDPQRHVTLDWTQWTRLDPCCTPSTDSNLSADAFLPCLGLDNDEFHCLELELLEASAHIPEEIVRATVMAKMHVVNDAPNTRMAAILL